MAQPQQPKSHHTGKSGAGRFTNPWKSFRSYGVWDFIKTRWNDWRKVEPTAMPTVRPNYERIAAAGNNNNNDDDEGVLCTWIGHASFLLQFDNLNVITDPIFSERCSAVQFAGPKRIVSAPDGFKTLEHVPQIDIAVISHNHFDHLDTNSVKLLANKVDRWYVPLGIKPFLVSCGVDAGRVAELDWWQEDNASKKNARVVCTPCQHFSGRSLMDRCATLWCSWAIVSGTKRVYFSGDTGYRSVDRGMSLEQERDVDKVPVCPAFKQIGDRLGPFDLSCIAIGAYGPRHFMSPVHLSPEDAVDVHIDIRSKQSVAMHWGTFLLTDEPILEPPMRLRAAMKAVGLNEDAFVTLKHGETHMFLNE